MALGELEPIRATSRRNAWKWTFGLIAGAGVASLPSEAQGASTFDSRVFAVIARQTTKSAGAVRAIAAAAVSEFSTTALPVALRDAAASPTSDFRVVLDRVYASAVPPAQPSPAILRVRALLAGRDSRHVTVATVGSSTTAGSGATSIDRRYVNRLAATLQRAFMLADGRSQPTTILLAEAGTASSPERGIRFVNAAVGNTTSADYLNEGTSAQVAALRPAIVLHMVGSNDYALQVPLADYKSNMQGQIARLDKLLGVGKCVHVLVHSFERGDRAASEIPWSGYGDILAEVAAEHPGYRLFLNLAPALSTVGVPTPNDYGLLDDDRVHPSDAGHAFLADLIARGLTDL